MCAEFQCATIHLIINIFLLWSRKHTRCTICILSEANAYPTFLPQSKNIRLKCQNAFLHWNWYGCSSISCLLATKTVNANLLSLSLNESTGTVLKAHMFAMNYLLYIPTSVDMWASRGNAKPYTHWCNRYSKFPWWHICRQQLKHMFCNRKRFDWDWRLEI